MCSRSAGLALAFVAAFAAAGCGDGKAKVYTVEGTLLLDDEPFGPTSIMLTPLDRAGRSVTGKVDESGKITFTSYGDGDGVPAGEYRVVVGTTFDAPPRPFPEVYRSFEKTPLQVAVDPTSENQFTINMDSSAGPPARSPSFGPGVPTMDGIDPGTFSAGADGNDNDK